MQIQRNHFSTLFNRLKEKRRFIQVIAGPRQVGKTTLVHQVCEQIKGACQFASADEPTLKPTTWIEQQWQTARLKIKQSKNVILVFDEIQKLPHWSETVKKLWDEDTATETELKVVLLGSSPLLIQTGLSESLAGRFEIIHMQHWSYEEMQSAFGWDLDTYMYFGAYPGSAELIEDEQRWRDYILDSLIETSISRDILLMNRIDKPALLRRLFQLGCEYSSQILSYQKMMGQLQDAGNTTTLAHYLDLLSGAGLLTGLSKYAGQKVRQRASSPKLQILNTALMTAQAHASFGEVKAKPETWGRVVESAVGAHLVNAMIPLRGNVYYWNRQDKEVDYVIELGKKFIAIEVKSAPKASATSGMAAFKKEFTPQKIIQVGGNGLPLEDFFTYPVKELFD